jgi:hypothetical protein
LLKGRNRSRGGNDQIQRRDIDTRGLTIPEIIGGRALKHREEEIEDGEDGDNGHCCINYDLQNMFSAYPDEE